MKRQFGMSFVVGASLIAAGCSGGGGAGSAPAASIAGASPSPLASASQAPAAVTRTLDITFGGTTTLARARRTQSLGGTPITITYNGRTVATGTLDANGHAAMTFTADVPRGATLVVTAGSVKATVVLADVDDGTAASVTVNPDGTLTVTAQPEHPGSNSSPAPSPSPGAASEGISEDRDGNPIAITTTMNALPANLPVTVSASCGEFTIAPSGAALPHVLIEMKSHDDDSATHFRFEGALTGPVSFPVPAGTLRVHVRIFAPGGGTLLDVRGPITASTSASGASPCPSPAASPSPSALPSASPVMSPSPSPSASASPSPSASASPSANPSSSPSASPSAAPTASATP